MTARLSVRTIARHWIVFTLITLVSVASAAIFTLTSKRVYGSSTQILVSASKVIDPQSAYQGELFTEQRVQTYAILLRGEYLAERVISRYHLTLSPGDLASRITPSVPTSTSLVNIAVTGSSPQEAQKLSTHVTDEFIRLTEQYETSPSTKKSTVRLTITRPAQISTRPLSPRPLINIGVALVLGMLLGAVVASARSLPDRPEATGPTDGDHPVNASAIES